MSKEVPLSEILKHISSELTKATKLAKSSGNATMQFEECEIEFAVKAEKDAKGGVKLWAVNLSGGAKKTESNTVKVKFKKIDGHTVQASLTENNEIAPKITRKKKKD